MTRKLSKKQSKYFGSTSKKLSGIVTIKSAGSFRKSISTLRKKGLTLKEKRALVLAKNRASAQLKRKNLSKGERRSFKGIVNTKLPKVSKK